MQALPPPIKYLWGTFCKNAITDKATNEVSMIGILNEITIELTVNLDEKPGDQQIQIMLAPLAFVSTWKRAIQEETDLNVPLIVVAAYNNELQEPSPATLPFKSQDGYAILSVILSGFLVTLPRKYGTEKRELEISFYLGDLVVSKTQTTIITKVSSPSGV